MLITRPVVAAAIMIAAPAVAQTAAAPGARERGTVLMSENPATRQFQEANGYADAVVIDGTIYLSGVATGYGGGDETLDQAYERTFQRIGKTLARAGASWADVVDITSLHTDITIQLAPFTRVKNRYVKTPFPAWTVIGVTRLFDGSAISEVKVIARIRAK